MNRPVLYCAKLDILTLHMLNVMRNPLMNNGKLTLPD